MQQRFAILLSAGALAFSVACSQTDAGITGAIKSKMAADDQVKASDINVDTHNHIVTLNGNVASMAEKERAETIARDTKGVTNVVNDLVVRPAPSATSGREEEKPQATDTTRVTKGKTESTTHEAKVKTEEAASKTGELITDAAITTDVKTKLAAEPGVSALDIHVDTNKHVVTLSGTVKNKAEARKAMTIARGSKGVKRVVSHLKVAA